METAEVHTYDVTVTWTGDDGEGTATYRSYRRDHVASADGPPELVGSSDPALRGDRSRWNPEQLLVVSLSQCHMLWYLHLCALNDVVVTGYVDAAHGEMAMNDDGSGQFEAVILRPQVTVTDPAMVERATALHADVPGLCFIARSVNFPVHHEPVVTVG
ncbi:MAG: OsmC family protein [Acidimicrobiales bacterium]